MLSQKASVLMWTIDLDIDSLKTRLWQATTYCLSVPERQDLLAEDLETAITNRAVAVRTVEKYNGEATQQPT